MDVNVDRWLIEVLLEVLAYRNNVLNRSNQLIDTDLNFFFYLYKRHFQADCRFFLMHENLSYLRMYNLAHLFHLVVAVAWCLRAKIKKQRRVDCQKRLAEFQTRTRKKTKNMYLYLQGTVRM